MTTPTDETRNLQPAYKRQNDGSLIKIEKIDTTKRYGSQTNVSTNETIFIQYSEDEEAAADKMKAEIESDPSPEEEAEAARIEHQKFLDSVKYERRIVAFIDILGWSNQVYSTSQTQDEIVKLGGILKAIQSISNFLINLPTLPDGSQFPGDIRITQFSDCIVASAEDSYAGKQRIESLISNLYEATYIHGVFLRGGVTIGDIHHKTNMVFGPALNDAYNLESKEAIYPRIILGHHLGLYWQDTTELLGQAWKKSNHDEYFYYNFMPPFKGGEFFMQNKELWKNRLDIYAKEILKNAKSNLKNQSIFNKYVWLAKYHDETLAYNSDCGAEPISNTILKLTEHKNILSEKDMSIKYSVRSLRD